MKDNQYHFQVRLNLNRPDHRKAYEQLIRHSGGSRNSCVVEALCRMEEHSTQVLQPEQLRALLREELQQCFRAWQGPAAMAASEGGVKETDAAPNEDDLDAAMNFMEAL